jgi:hypothetical protein
LAESQRQRDSAARQERERQEENQRKYDQQIAEVLGLGDDGKPIQGITAQRVKSALSKIKRLPKVPDGDEEP